jgi:O-antigen/teichoic acid export membrane protein
MRGVSGTAGSDDLRRLLLRLVVVSLVVTAAVAIVALLASDFGDTQLRVILTTGAVSLYGLMALPAGILLEQGRFRPLARAVAVAVATAFVLVVYLIWAEWNDTGETEAKITVVATTVAGVLAQVAAALSRRRAEDSLWVVRLTAASIGAGALLGAMIVVAVLAEVDDSGYYRLLGAVAVADVLLLALPPVLRRGQPEAADAQGRVRLVVEVDAADADEVGSAVESRGAVVVRRERA